MAGNRPEEKVSLAVNLQQWRLVTFVHWRCDPIHVAGLLPPGLRPHLVDGSAWVGLTPFVIRGARPPFLPPLMGVSDFPETNLRTYVVGPDGQDGIWFLSLDAASIPAVLLARSTVGAPYHWARLRVERPDTGELVYQGTRRGGEAGYRLRVRVEGPPRSDVPALVGALAGRWRAYTRRLGRLLCVPVEHGPWPLQHAELLQCEESVTAAAGLPQLGPPELVHFAEGVDVRIGPPRLVPSVPSASG